MQSLKLSLDVITSRLNWVVLVPMTVLIFLLINLGLISTRPDLFLEIAFEQVEAVPTVVRAVVATSTPYQPAVSTPAAFAPVTIPASGTLTYPPYSFDQGQGIPAAGPSTDFHAVDFSPGASRIKIILQPENERLKRGKPIVITVNPGRSCPYRSHRACISAFRPGGEVGMDASQAGNVILISVHSGIGGEAEAFRRFVEGMGLNQAGFSIQQIRSNLARLEGASVRIQQGERAVEGLRLVRVARVPPRLVRDYFHGSPEQALALAASVDPELLAYTHPDGPILLFETCGWKLAGEPWAPGVTDTTGSVYVGVIEVEE